MTTTNEPLGGEPSHIEQIIACLGDDAATLEATNPDDEIAQNMREAAKIIEALANQQAGAVGASEVKTWQERTSIPMPEPHEMLFSMRQIHAAKDAEIADLRAQLVRQQAPVGDSVDELAKDCDYYMTSGERPPESFYRQVRSQLVNITAWKDAQLALERQGANCEDDPVGAFQAEARQAKLDDFIASTRSAQAQGEPVAKPYAYEYGKSNGDGTYSIVIDRGDMVKISETKYEYGPPKNAVKDRPVKSLYLRPAPQADEVRDAARWRWFAQHGFFWRGEHCLQTCWPKHGEIGVKDPQGGAAKLSAINDAIDTAIRTTAADNQKG